MTMLTELFNNISLGEWLLLAVNACLLLFAGQIYQKLSLNSDQQISKQVYLFRIINIAIIGLILYKNIVNPLIETNWLTKTLYLLFVTYIFILAFKIYAYFIHYHYGKRRESEAGVTITETYNSRALILSGGILFFIIWLISCIQLLQLNTLLEAGGVIGFVGVMLALTQGAWAPDIISGLIILNGNMVEVGDILQITHNGKKIYANVYKTKMFHTELLDLSNNHRIMIKNTQLRELFLQNLSKFASAKGLREKLSFNIGYDVPPKAVRDLFTKVETTLQQEFSEFYESQHPIEVFIDDTGNHAIQWTFFFYTKQVKQLLKVRQIFREVILNQAITDGISLATPITHQSV